MKTFYNLQEEEQLANEVQKYPCLYDKPNPGHYEKDRVINAWELLMKHLDSRKVRFRHLDILFLCRCK